MQKQIISSSCKATPTKYTHNFFSHLLQHTLLISLISLIFLSVLTEASPVPSKALGSPVPLGASEVPKNALGSITSVPNLQSFANYAAAAYIKKPLQNWDCGDICLATKGTQLVKDFGNVELNTRGYIAMDPTKELIVVSYRGTEPGSIKNYFSDIIIVHDSYPPVPGALVHHGFLNAFEQIQPEVTDDLIKLINEKPTFKIGFMGHSLGGVLATYSALDLIQKMPELAKKNERLFLATFGQPRMGDVNFAKYVDDNVKAIRSIVRGDPIPRMPPSWEIPFIGSYRHFGEELYIDNPDVDPTVFRECPAEDPTCSESVPFGELALASHSGPYYGVNMRDATKEPVENYDFSANPYFNYDPNFDYKGAAMAKGVDGTKGVNGTEGVKDTKEVKGTKY